MVFVTCLGTSGEMIYITFLYDGLSALGIYPEDLDPVNFCFQWPTRTKIQHMYQKFLKEGNGDQKYLRCLDL